MRKSRERNNAKISRQKSGNYAKKKHENFAKNYCRFKRFFLVIGWLMASWIRVIVRGRTETQKDSEGNQKKNY